MEKASHYTCQHNQQMKSSLPFNQNHELNLAKQNCVASFNKLEIIQENKVIWSQKAYDFLENDCPESANPSLWENARCNHQTGLFRVTDKIFQLRGFDMANLSLILTRKNTWVIFDTLMSIECSRAAIKFANRWFEKNGYPIVDGHIAGIVISHSHVDHFGGLRGLFPDFTLDPEIPIFAPTGFTEAAIAENLMAGKAMGRRAGYQYGTLLEKSPTGSLSIGIGQGQSLGTVSFELPTKEITENQTLEVDGLEMVFQLTPGTEAPAEMNTYFPQYEALWMAENCTCTMHNLYTLRGAQVRDATAWAKYLLEAKELFGNQAKVMFHAHTWPRYATDEEPDTIKDYLISQARLYKGIHDQTLTAINKGYTFNELENQITLPKELTEKWYLRPYYGTISHNSKAVYQKYMGWYDSNPVNLDPLPPIEEAKNFVSYMGGAEKVLQKAAEDYRNGNYRWVAKVTNLIVFAEPNNLEARHLCNKALTQLGYQAESGTWRNEYLTGALELIQGTIKNPDHYANSSPDLINHLTGEMVLNYLSLLTVHTDKQLSGTIVFEDDWAFENGVYKQQTSCYKLDYWQGILTYYPIDLTKLPSSEEWLYRGNRIPFMNQLLHTKADGLKEWSGLFEVNPDERYFNIVEP
ncbi:MBL fold metallo-hydrolase [Enterococcus raffinosus]|uniref:alkyl/aryl-sulfatase n=1 Tax=Enterococcus raffinosus TaxID=71452 RepID=UPI001C105F75|nr:alkyl sulfatase dimerization domain-containing protein [Enterococcus raffinosus]MBU5363284.1 MBL fold metallo-hydrolase [Enterococcus raffinosus]